MNSPKDSLTREDHQNALEVVYEISSILNTGLDRDSLNILVNLCESGVNPEALAAVVQELRSSQEAGATTATKRRTTSCWEQLKYT
ncbi:unnamed protein product [Heterosigma akashiwo]